MRVIESRARLPLAKGTFTVAAYPASDMFAIMIEGRNGKTIHIELSDREVIRLFQECKQLTADPNDTHQYDTNLLRKVWMDAVDMDILIV